MKKRFIIIGIAVLVVIGAVVACLLLFRNKAEPAEDTIPPEEKQLLTQQQVSCILATDCQELWDKNNSSEINLEFPADGVMGLSEPTVDGRQAYIYFTYRDTTIDMVRWSYDICKVADIDPHNEDHLDLLAQDIFNMVEQLGMMVNEYITDVPLYSKEGYRIDNSDMENYAKLLTGDAIFDIVIRDREGTIWNGRTFLSEDGVLSAQFYRSLDKAFNETMTADITVGAEGIQEPTIQMQETVTETQESTVETQESTTETQK